MFYDGSQLTGVCNPVDTLDVLSSHVPGISLPMVAETMEPVSASPKCWPSANIQTFSTLQSLLPKYGFKSSPDLEVLLIPGGMGCFDPGSTGKPNFDTIDPLVKLILARYPKLKYLITFCTDALDCWTGSAQRFSQGLWVR